MEDEKTHLTYWINFLKRVTCYLREWLCSRSSCAMRGDRRPPRHMSRLMDKQERHDLFVELITRHQGELYGYIFAVVRNREDADDLYQSVGMILWRKFESFRPDSSFISWAGKTASFVVRNFLKRKKRPVYVSEGLSEALIETASEAQCDTTESYLAALDGCRRKLGLDDEELLKLRYVEELGTRQIAEQLGRAQASVCHSLARIRHWLFDCISVEMVRQKQAVREPS
jgi:RNA polymerase sigma-70 factor, ECF subfamily